MRPKKTPTVKESAKQVTDLAVDSVRCYKLFFWKEDPAEAIGWIVEHKEQRRGVTINQSHSIKQRNPKENSSKKIVL